MLWSVFSAYILIKQVYSCGKNKRTICIIQKTNLEYGEQICHETHQRTYEKTYLYEKQIQKKRTITFNSNWPIRINIESGPKKSLHLYLAISPKISQLSKKLTFSLNSRHIVISKMVRHDFLSYLRPEKSLKISKYESQIFDIFCSFSRKLKFKALKVLKWAKTVLRISQDSDNSESCVLSFQKWQYVYF